MSESDKGDSGCCNQANDQAYTTSWLSGFALDGSRLLDRGGRRTSARENTEDIERIDLNSGKVRNKWHCAHLLSWISPDGVWATTYYREAIYLPTQRIAGKLEYVPATVRSAPWNVDYGYLAARILKEVPPVYLVMIAFYFLELWDS